MSAIVLEHDHNLMLLHLIDIQTNERIDTLNITVSKWRENSLFYDSYLNRWNDSADNNEIQQSISSDEIQTFMQIAYYFEKGCFLNPCSFHTNELMEIMNMACFLGATKCLQEAFDKFNGLFVYPSLEDLITVSKADYFVNLKRSSVFYHKYVLKVYEDLNNIPETALARFPLDFIDALLSWDKLIVDSENDVVVFVLKWMDHHTLSKQELLKIRTLIRVSRLSLPFINQVLKNLPFMGITDEQINTLQSFKFNEQYFDQNNCLIYFDGVLMKEWFLEYRTSVRFNTSQCTCAWLNSEHYNHLPNGQMMQTKITTEEVQTWLCETSNDDPLVLTLQTDKTYCGFDWVLVIQLHRDYTIHGLLTCSFNWNYGSTQDVHIMACVRLSVGCTVTKRARECVLHTNRMKCLLDLSSDWELLTNNGLVVTATIDAMDT